MTSTWRLPVVLAARPVTVMSLSYPRSDLAIIRDVTQRHAQKLSRVPGIVVESWHSDFCDIKIPRNCWTLPGTRDLFSLVGVAPPVWLEGDTSFNRILLRDYQADAVAFISKHGRVILGDQMGLGKTRTAAIASHHFNSAKPTVILAPRALRQSWYDELGKIGALRGPDDFVALEGVNPPPFTKLDPRARFIFVHYDIVTAWWNQLWPLRPDVVILDEAHWLKNGRSKRAKAAALVSSVANHRIALTGTPILNRLGELWNVLDITVGKWSFGGPKQFRERYCGAIHDDFGHLADTELTHQAELQERLSTCYLRRTVEDVKLDLPPITRTVVEVPLCADASEAYATALGGRDPRSVADAVLHGRASTEALTYIAALRKITSDAKLEYTYNQIVTALAQDEPVVCFSWRRDTAEDISRMFWETDWFTHTVHGGINPDERDARISHFRRCGGLLSATFGALAEGVNLQTARVVIMHDLDFTPAKMLQAEARVWRQGQLNAVQSFWMVAEGTLDAFIARHLINKSQLIEKALDDPTAGALGTLLSDQHDAQDDVMETIRRWQSWRQR